MLPVACRPRLFLDLCCLVHLAFENGTKKRNSDTTAASASSSGVLAGPLRFETQEDAGDPADR